MPQLASSATWHSYFQANSIDRGIPYQQSEMLTDKQRKTIQKSLQEFQLGESGEGRHIFHQAKKWAEKSGDDDYLPALRLFIAEEIRHARELGGFMDRAGIPRIRKCAFDNIFRWVRHRAGLELSISVLVMAEIIAKIYYQGLAGATQNQTLKHICNLILKDEVEHVRFQCQRLAILRKEKSFLSQVWRSAAYRVFFSVTSTLIWFGKHGRVMRAAGWTFTRYRRELLSEYYAAAVIANPHTYFMRAEEPADALGGSLTQ
jgi:hypothetical protein